MLTRALSARAGRRSADTYEGRTGPEAVRRDATSNDVEMRIRHDERRCGVRDVLVAELDVPALDRPDEVQ